MNCTVFLRLGPLYTRNLSDRINAGSIGVGCVMLERCGGTRSVAGCVGDVCGVHRSGTADCFDVNCDAGRNGNCDTSSDGGCTVDDRGVDG